MTTEGIEAVFLETHNWGKSAKFFQTLGYEIEFAYSFNNLTEQAVTVQADFNGPVLPPGESNRSPGQ